MGLSRRLGKVGTLRGLHWPVQGLQMCWGFCPWALKGRLGSQAPSDRKEAPSGFEAGAPWEGPPSGTNEGALWGARPWPELEVGRQASLTPR